MNPDVAAAVVALREDGVLTDPPAAHLLRVARRELVSVRLELRILLYAGVLLVTSGAGLLVKENYERLGPVAIAAVLFATALACFAYVLRKTPPFSWHEVPSPTIAFDYVLLLSVLLFGSDLAYVETQFHLLGTRWSLHLLIASLVALAAAYRFDSRAVLSLALTSFAAWRRVSTSLSLEGFFASRTDAMRVNALLCAAIFLAAAWLGHARDRKSHFAGVYANLALFLLFGALLSGVFEQKGWALWLLALAVTGGAAVVVSFRHARPWPFTQAVVALTIGSLRLVFEVLPFAPASLVVSIGSIVVLALLIKANRGMRRS